VRCWFLLFLLAVRAKSLHAQDQNTRVSEHIGSVTVLKGYNAPIRETVREVVRNPERWRAIRDSIYLYRAPGIVEPQVDFRRHVLIVAIGPAARPEDSLTIQDVSLSHGKIRVTVASYRKCYPDQQVTMPYQVIRIPQLQRQATFKEKTLHNKKTCGRS
jgi:hypothetical protein